MKFPENWLREHVATTASRDELAARLTAIGLEVEDLQPLGEGLDGVVVAEILSCEKHPEADRLQVCQVATGAGTVQIVCGAPNARAGLKAPLAQVGANLPGGIAIKAAKLRGVESQGMLCSARELGVDADASGLLELPADAPVGQPISAFLGLPDASFELKLTPNRADCFSVRGIAFDVAATTGEQVVPMAIPEATVASAAKFEVMLGAGADCPRYCGRVIEGVDARARSPLWLTERLKRSGLRPISPLVDITNYVMLELGQPMHAFDADTLKGPVGVRRARAGETLKLLDEREVALDEGFLAITDGDRPVALAGVMGGFETRVTDATTRVFLESAHFAPDVIIGRARKLGMHTDASHRFERGVDPELPRLALERATALVLEIMGGQAGAITEAVLPEHLPRPAAVSLRRERLRRVLGVSVADAEVERILRALGMQVEATAEGWRVLPPSRRFDIAIEEDLVEEVARIHGYERIPTTTPTGEVRLVAPSETRVSEAVLRRQLAGRDFLEAINYAFLDADTLATWQLQDGAVALANPLTAELGVMRTALLPGLVSALGRNQAHQQKRVRLFELGKVFHLAEGAPRETPRIAAVACGPQAREQWAQDEREVDFYDLKAEVEGLLALAGVEGEFRPDDSPWGHPGRSASVWRDGRRIGWVGHLHPRLARALDLDGEVVGFELDLEPLATRAVPRARELSRFPSVRRDIALVVPESTPWAALQASLKAALGPLLREVVLFDRYVGPGLESGSKSLAMGLILQDVSRTLTDRDADQAVATALGALDRDCGARLRS
ncbi:MAG: phenylalanine--tRNA ligase subunit beta [Arenimonas sp. SCN 70-307]|uniref:phenylalanine--tRNA ligase subunit beta n=1 Tax=Arenimonas sp. SCN 70-307 TaxID=1660089 RepID=UPI000868C7F3|nr:phenylalanine--tRNA ligase subunit beta [Arenimonas sp. SCN 70-307]ODS63485.1 MAG: phenylalanine--tRNA ligase subunit beta [Arenimonas sp. SCN 70-307]